MPDLQEMFKDAWSHALAGVNAAEQEAEKVLARIADVAGFSPEDVRRHAREFGERLTVQRRELERTIDDAVRRATSRFRVPSREDLEALEKRLEAIAAARRGARQGEGQPSDAAPPPRARRSRRRDRPRGRRGRVSRRARGGAAAASPRPSVARRASRRAVMRRAPVVVRIDRQLGNRMPALEAESRLALARTIVAEAQAARIDPLLVLALIQVESSFDPRALSVAGARGLMQLREPTLRRELERAGLPHLDLHDPAANVVAGVRYLRRLLDAFGREEVALMAYNAGPNRILGYLREGEIPERFQAYPRRVQAVHRKLRRNVVAPVPPLAVASAREAVAAGSVPA